MISGTLKKYILSRVIPARAVVYSNNNATLTAIPTGATFTKYSFAGTQVVDFKNIGADIENEQSVILKKGMYLVECTFCSEIDANNVSWETCVLVNGVESPSLHIERHFLGSATLSSATISGLIPLERNDTVAIGVRHNYGSTVNITTKFSSLLLLKI